MGSGGVIEIIPDYEDLGDFLDDPDYFKDNPKRISFEYQQDPWPTIQSVIGLNSFVEYGKDVNCLILVKGQIAITGVRDLGYGSAYKVFDSQGGPYADVAENGVEYIITKLKSGKPVVVGVDNRVGSPSSQNADGKTDHFVTIVGAGEDAAGKYFTFFDNATNLVNKGANVNNKLYYNSATGLITGKSATTPSKPKYYDYKVTQMWKNK